MHNIAIIFIQITRYHMPEKIYKDPKKGGNN